MYKNEITDEILQRAKKIKLLLMDCDGVLTDGRLYFSKDGEELKVFNVKDGQGINSWHKAGFKSGVITGRESQMLKKRCQELGVHYLVQSSNNKLSDFNNILKDSNLSAEEIAYIGDDISDISLLNIVGLPIAVADSVEKLLPKVLLITNKKGGFGAVREVIDLLLKSKKSIS